MYYIVTHCCPTPVQDELSGGSYRSNALTDFLDEITQRCEFKYNFFGHYHTNKIIRKKYVLLYEQIIRLKRKRKASSRPSIKDNADTIIGNCDCSIFLGGKEPSTLKDLSAALGKETIDTFNIGESLGRELSHSLNYQKLGKDMP